MKRSKLWQVHSVLPGSIVKEIQKNIALAQTRHTRQMTTWAMLPETLVGHLIDEKALHGCRLGYSYGTDHNRYGDGAYELPGGVIWGLPNRTCQAMHMIAPRPEYAKDAVLFLPELVEYIRQVNDIRRAFAKVEFVFNWFNAHHISPAAIRSYCPWVLSLISAGQHERFEGDRFTEPGGLGPMLGLIREVAGTVAMALLIQEDPPVKVARGYSFTFAAFTDASWAKPIPVAQLIQHF